MKRSLVCKCPRAHTWHTIVHACFPLQANETVVNVQEDFSDLERQLLLVLQDMPRAQASSTRQQNPSWGTVGRDLVSRLQSSGSQR